jgi:hypothetical protein
VNSAKKDKLLHLCGWIIQWNEDEQKHYCFPFGSFEPIVELDLFDPENNTEHALALLRTSAYSSDVLLHYNKITEHFEVWQLLPSGQIGRLHRRNASLAAAITSFLEMKLC